MANDGHGHIVHSFGHPKTVAIQRALAMARLYGWTNARIVAATDVTGYGAIAVAAHKHKGGGSVVGVSIGNGSQAEADTEAIQICLKANGFDARVRWRFRG